MSAVVKCLLGRAKDQRSQKIFYPLVRGKIKDSVALKLKQTNKFFAAPSTASQTLKKMLTSYTCQESYL